MTQVSIAINFCDIGVIFIKYSFHSGIMTKGNYGNEFANIRRDNMPFEHIMKSGNDDIWYKD